MIYSSQNNNIPIGGNLGNQIMRIMSLMGLAKKYNVDWAIPEWEYAKYFDNQIPQTSKVSNLLVVREPHFHYSQDFLDSIDWSRNIDLHGFLQSPLYWQEPLKFKKEFLDEIKSKYSFKKNPIAISVRRGDFVGHVCYWQTDENYYLGALKKYFPDYKARDIFVFSDDFNWCRIKFSSLNKDIVFVEEEPIVQLAAMSLCSDFIISQSTFAYVGAYLANRGIVIRPIKNFDGIYAIRNDEKDFWPENDRWIPFTEKELV